jgi:F0F1-type ATP synthase membrane subunit c/vacuolar-type H+-ATPase subunit K
MRSPPPRPVPPALAARIVHAALVLGIAIFWIVAWYVGSTRPVPTSELPERKVLYLALFAVSAVAFGAAMYTAGRLVPRAAGVSADDWWQRNFRQVVLVWALVDAPAIFGIVAYLLTHDFRALIAPFTGLFLFVNYRPSRFAEP